MVVVSQSVIIQAPVDVVFAFCSSPVGFETQFPFKVQWIQRPERWRNGDVIHFSYRVMGCWLVHQAKITEFCNNSRFVDEAEGGFFSIFRHEHLFRPEGNSTIYTDSVSVSIGLGKIVDAVLLRSIVHAVFKKRQRRLQAALNK